MIELPNKKKCYNLPEQVAQNLLNIQYLAEQYKNIDALPAIWKTYKEEFDNELEIFGEWTTTFEGWTESLSTYLANMSSAAVGAIAGQNIAPANIAATGNITANSIIENMAGYSFTKQTHTNITNEIIYAGAVKNGNKLTLVVFQKFTRTGTAYYIPFGEFSLPLDIANKIYTYAIGGGTANVCEVKKCEFIPNVDSGYNSAISSPVIIYKSGSSLTIRNYSPDDFTLNQEYLIRFEVTFLLSDNLAS